ncbi:MFS general substrate transporter [Ceratobasidium sp. AG-I]|nr:MFS general substrate transporter [Ceratobasidium sp. AG-I]
MTPGREQWDRAQTLVGYVLVALASGTNYVYSAYAPQMGKRLNLSSTQLNIIGIAGNVGVYLFAPLCGWVVDGWGPKRPLYIASGFLVFGYGGIRYLFTNAPPAPPNGGSGLVLMISLFTFVTGLAGCTGIGSAGNAIVKSSTPRWRAGMIGVVNSAFGLSAFFFSLIARELFPGETRSFLTVLLFGTALPVFFGAAVIRPKAVGVALRAEEDREVREAESAGTVVQDEETPLRAGEANLIYGERNAATSGAVAAKDSTDETLNVHGLGLFKLVDFWILFGIIGMLGGPGLMYINNVGSIVQALFAARDEKWDEKAAAAAQAYQVSILSVSSFFGRLIIGFLADYLSHAHAIPRAACFILSSVLGIVAQSMLVRVESADALWKVSMTLGMSYGTTFALFSVLVLEHFGITHFSQNCGVMAVAAVLLGNVFNYGFGRNFDAHVGVPHNLVGATKNLQCFVGRKCYIASPWEQLLSACAQLVGSMEEFETGKRSCGFDLNLA